jgi:DNA-binding transcriptional regulator LsrR (DeoR family)
MATEQIDAAKELVAIKRLLIVALINSGSTQGQIAAALGIDRTGVGRMFPKGALTGLKAKGKADD